MRDNIKTALLNTTMTASRPVTHAGLPRKGDWRFSALVAEANTRTDFLFVLPLSDFARPDMISNWLMSINRYNKQVSGALCTARSKTVGFRSLAVWPIVALPPEVVRPYTLGVAGGGKTDASVALDLLNNTGAPRAVKTVLSAGSVKREREVELKPGMTTVAIPLDATGATKVAVRIEEHGHTVANQLIPVTQRKPVTALGRRNNYENVLTQMVMDEPELVTPSDVARDFLRKMRPYFPYHPVQMNNTVIGIPQRYAEKEILFVTDVICSEKESGGAVCDGHPKLLRHLTKRHDGALYVVTCNIDAGPAGKVTFTLPAGTRYVERAEVLFEDRSVAVKNGVFADTYPGHTRHVYRIGILK